MLSIYFILNIYYREITKEQKAVCLYTAFYRAIIRGFILCLRQYEKGGIHEWH